jgi:hypothetical protein
MQSDTKAIVLTADHHLEVPVECGLLEGIYSRYQESRTDLLRLVGRAQSLVPVIAELREIVERTPDHGFKVVFPPGALGKFRDGVWELKDAKDGSGLLPTIYGGGRQFVKQVRLEQADIQKLDPSALANAAAHAQTHALLREVLATLDDIEKKLDLQLAYDRADWTGQIAAGVEQYRAVNLEPGDPANRAAVLANAQQSLAEGQRRGLLKLSAYLDQRLEPVKKRWRQFLPFGNPKVQAPSLFHAETLDRVEEDFGWLYSAARTKAAIHADSGRPIAAANEVMLFAEEFADAATAGHARFSFARYSKHREEFWRFRLPALIEAPQRRALPVAIECTAQELLSATVEGETDDGK